MPHPNPFLPLLKFQMKSNPFIWIMPIAFSAPLLIGRSFSGHANLGMLLSIQNLFMVGIVGMWVLAPEMATGFRGASTISGSEFLLTRAVDRASLYRSRTAYLYLLVLLIPLITLLYALRSPDVTVTEYVKAAQERCLQAVPGSHLIPDPNGSTSPFIAIACGSILIEEWHLWLYLVTSLAAQVLLIFLFPFRFRIQVFYALFMGAIFIPLLIDLGHLNKGTAPDMEMLFFWFSAHQLLFWSMTALVFILGQAWCERRFARQQY